MPQPSRATTSRYRLTTLLGTGGTANVYHAYDRLTGQPVAYKQLLSSIEKLRPATLTPSNSPVTDHELRLLLAHEFQVLASLRHPNIISVLDYGFESESQPFFTMDLVEQPRTIVTAARREPFDLQVLFIGQMLRALDYLHRRGVLHCDLKPSNVLVDGDQVKMVDFGLALVAGRHRQAPVGTLLYMAPEVLAGGQPSIASDLYGVGLIAYEMFTGQPPFSANDVSELIDSILSTAPNLSRNDLPASARTALERLLAKNPADRPATAAEALAVWATATGLRLELETPETRESFLQAAPFVSRQAELTQLTQALKQAQGGQGSSWLLGGESGVGKSRLMDEVRTRALVEGAVVLQGQSVSDGGAPLHVWRGIARWLALLAEPDDLEAGVLIPLVPDIANLIERPVPDPPALAPQAAQTRLLSVITALIKRVAETQPTVILLADLHWADDNSLELLAWVNRLLPDRPLFIVGDYRNDEASRLPQRFPDMHVLTLDRLALDNIAALSASILGPAGRSKQIVDYLWRESEGNTFFVVEVVRSLAEKAGNLENISRITFPTRIFGGGIQRLVENRLRRLSSNDHAGLQLAAVAGRHVDPRLLAEAGLPDLTGWLNRCAEASVLEAHTSGWRFVHDKLREGLLANLDPQHEKELHAQVGTAIERAYVRDLGLHYVELAFHFQQAGKAERERRYAQLAGEQAAAQYANAEAISFISRAIELAPPNDLRIRYALLRTRERVYDLQRDQSHQDDDLQAMTTIAETLDEGTLKAEVAWRRANAAEARGDYAEAYDLAQRAVALAHEVSASHIEGAARMLAGRARWQIGDLSPARTELEQGLALARQLNMRSLEADSLRNIGIIFDFQTQRAEALDYHRQALDIFSAIGDRRGEGRSHNNIAVTQHYLGDPIASRHHGKRAYEIAHAIGDRLGERVALGNLALDGLRFGDYERALIHITDAAEIQHGAPSTNSEGWIGRMLGNYYFCIGDYASAEARLRAAVNLNRQTGSRNELCVSLQLLGDTLFQIGRLEEAHQAYTEAIEVNDLIDPTHPSLDLLANSAALALQRGNQAQALEQIEQVLSRLDPQTILLTDDPIRVELNCYRVLQAAGDPRARDILNAAHTRLQRAAATLPDDRHRRMYFENVHSNRSLLAEYQAIQQP